MTDETENPIPVVQYLRMDWPGTLICGARLLSLCFALLYVIAGASSPQASFAYFQKVMLSAAAAYSLRLYQRTGPIRIRQDFLKQLLGEDSLHYLLYTFMFYFGPALLPPLSLVVVLQIVSINLFFKQLRQRTTINSILVNKFNDYATKCHDQLLTFAAFIEIMLFVYSILLVLTGQRYFILIMFYHRFLLMRYNSTRNGKNRLAFCQLRFSATNFLNKSWMPQILRSCGFKCIELICRMAP
ncbi:hypothetical protein SNEBB_000139 [Seison nebaliae]|nr:hypothetical protein SNEBB_000139 [Seison nebaliae]